MGHEHNVRDLDARFKIDPVTKQIKNESKKKLILAQGDHNSEIYGFSCPRYIESHDMSLCNKVEVHFFNHDSQTKKVNSGKYTVEDLKVGEDESTIEFSWCISGNGTQLEGYTEFLVRFKCVDENNVVTYAWNTLFFSDVSVGRGSNVDELFETEYVDIIEQWKASVLQGFEDEFTEWKGKIERQVSTDINKWKQEASEEVDDHFNAHSAEWNQKLAVERARIDQFTKLEEGSTTGDAELIDARIGADGGSYNSAGDAIRKQFNMIGKDVELLEEICVEQSVNLYDASLQTSDTISPHYWVNGAPYETTQFDEGYHCTAPIEVEQMTQYTVGVVPTEMGFTAPWAEASSGLFFFGENGEYLGTTKENTFITPVGTKTIRFNYARIAGINIYVLNQKCMLVKGNTLPDVYSVYQKTTMKERVDSLFEAVNANIIQYQVNGDEVKVSANYSTATDILVILKKKGGNNIFDFYQFATFEHGKTLDELLDADMTIIQTTGTDWHAPFIVKAVNDIDGDLPDSFAFTGGNHEYTNTGSGGTPTGQTTNLKIYVNNREVSEGCGICNRIEIKWTNLVQATNTKKEDGTGREVLQENHVLSFDGVEWTSYVEIIPLEDIKMVTWYGLQASGVSEIYKSIRYIGATNRLLYDGSAERTTCGDNKTAKVSCFGEEHKVEIEIDSSFDLGDRRYYSGTEGIFSEKYGKLYFYIASNAQLLKDCMYCLRGKYRFKPV